MDEENTSELYVCGGVCERTWHRKRCGLALQKWVMLLQLGTNATSRRVSEIQSCSERGGSVGSRDVAGSHQSLYHVLNHHH